MYSGNLSFYCRLPDPSSFFIGDKKVRGKFAFVSHFGRRGENEVRQTFPSKRETSHGTQRQMEEEGEKRIFFVLFALSRIQ